MSAQSLPKSNEFEILQVPDASATHLNSPILRIVMERTAQIYGSAPYEVEPGKTGWVFFVRKKQEASLEAPQSTNAPKVESAEVQPQ